MQNDKAKLWIPVFAGMIEEAGMIHTFKFLSTRQAKRVARLAAGMTRGGIRTAKEMGMTKGEMINL